MNKKAVTTDEFLRAFQCVNPFSKNRVSGAGDFEADVPEIHGEEFTKLVRRIQRVTTGKGSAGLLIIGAAGVGKSHLLGRLARWAEDKGEATVLFLHNILASPERMARYLLRASMSVLAGSRPEAYGKSELHRLLRRAIRARLDEKTRAGMPSLEIAAPTLDAIVREVDNRGDIARALIEFYRSPRVGEDQAARERARTAIQWLSGESISCEAAERLNLAEVDEEGAALADDAEVQLVFRVLAHLGATAGYPLVLCVDQVDNLDPDKVTALSSFLHAVIDDAKQMLVITSGVKESMLAFQRDGIIPKAAWDRIAQHKLTLSQTDERGARALIKARIDQFAAPFENLSTVSAKRRADELFPLDQAWLKNQLSLQPEFRPRDVVTWANDRWEQQQDRLDECDGREWMRSWPGECAPPPVSDITPEQAIDAAIAVKLVERLNERKLQPDALPPDADNLATLTLSLLERCRGREPYSLVDVTRSARGRKLPRYDLLVEERQAGGRSATSGVLFLSSDNATKVTHALQRMVDDPTPPSHRILVTDEERRPLPLGAKGKQLYQSLVKLGSAAFHHVALRFEGHAALDALQGLIASARVGDLEVDHPRGQSRKIIEAEAVESLHRQGKFAESPLLRELLTEEIVEPPPPPKRKVNEKRAKETIIANLSWRLCLTSHQITKEFIQVEHLESVEFESVHMQIKEVAQSMHAQGLLHATAVKEGLYLQLMQKSEQAQCT
jgi:GTPase SAR1 family protein